MKNKSAKNRRPDTRDNLQTFSPPDKAKVSWYEGVDAWKGKRGEKSLDEVFEIIRTRPIKNESRIRQLYLQRATLTEGTPEYEAVDKEYHDLKERLYGFTPSGVCPNGRDDKELVSYNGNVLLDFDKLPDEAERERIFQLLGREPYILRVWRSISGYGVKALAVWKYPDRPADKTGHRHAFSLFLNRMSKLTGHKIDRACVNESRLCFVAYDPDLWTNRNGFEPLVVKPPDKQSQPEPEPKPLSRNRRAQLLAWVERDGRVGKAKLGMRNDQPVLECERCPSGRQHKDVVIFLNGIPYLHCFHPESCAQAVADYNEQLRAVWTGMFYEDARQRYWIREKATPDKFMTVNDTRAKAALRALGVVKTVCDDWLYHICVWNNVRYAAPLAGYTSGIYEMFNEKILVTRSPKILEPARGSWPVLRKFLHGLLGEEQLAVFMGWLLVAYEALRSGEPRHGQALGLVGPAKAGKSLLQKIITVILGGRVKHPFKYMTGRTDFNAELFEAEHLCIDDEKASIDIRSRRELGTAIKMVCVNQEQTCFRKHATPVTLLPFWRLTISVNDDPEALQVLPPLDDDIADKLILLKTEKRPMPMPTLTGSERKRFWNTLVGELPALLYEIINEWKIPAKLLKSEWAERYGLDSFKNPDVVRELMELSPEWALLELLDQAYFPPTDPNGQTVFYKESIRATHRQIEQKLREVHETRVIDRLLSGPQHLSKYLGRLAKNRTTADRVKRVRGRSRDWVIEPPKKPLREEAF